MGPMRAGMVVISSLTLVASVLKWHPTSLATSSDDSQPEPEHAGVTIKTPFVPRFVGGGNGLATGESMKPSLGVLSVQYGAEVALKPDKPEVKALGRPSVIRRITLSAPT